MATEKERQEFIARFCAEYAITTGQQRTPAHPERKPIPECIGAARSLLRHARTHGRLAVDECNGCWAHSVPDEQLGGADPRTYRRAVVSAWESQLEKKTAACEKRIKEICAGFNLPVTMGGDPRGSTVKLKLPSGVYNTWGGSEDGYAVPQ